MEHRIIQNILLFKLQNIFTMKNLRLFTYISFSLFTLNVYSQSIVFPITNAVVSGGTVTEEVVIGSDTYKMEAQHTEMTGATLFNDMGNFMFFWSFSTFPTQTKSWTITLEKNGSPVNFDLNSIGYKSFDPSNTHSYNVRNNNSAIITNSHDVPSQMSGSFPIDSVANALNISSVEIEGLTIGATAAVDIDFIDLTVGNSMGIENIPESELAQIELYPNPTSNIVNVTNIPKWKNINIKVINSSGKVVLSMNENEINNGSEILELQLDEEPNGIYFIRLTGDRTETSKKFILNR